MPGYLAPLTAGGGLYLAPLAPPDVPAQETDAQVGWTEGDEVPLIYIRNSATITVPASRTVRFAGENRTVRF